MTATLELPERDSVQTSNQKGIGEQLRTAREQQNLSVKEAAARLFLSPKLIELIENEDFDKGLPIAFMRGYLRSYARLLNLPEETVNNALTQLGLNAPPATVIPPRLYPPLHDQSDRYMRWATFFIVTVLIVLVVMWWTTHLNDTKSALKNTAPAKQTTPAVSSVLDNPPESSPVLLTPPATQVTSVAAPSQPAPPVPAVSQTEPVSKTVPSTLEAPIVSH